MQHVDDADRASAADIATTIEDSGRRSRARRRRLAAQLAAVARRRRRRGSTTAAVLTLVVAAAAPLAVGHSTQRARSADSTSSATTLQRGSSGSAVRALQRALGITADGAFGPATARAVRRFQRRSGLEADGVAGPATLRALGLRTAPARDRDAAPADPAATLAAIAQCESGGDPTAVSSDGRYRGKYQFLRETWESLGGTGDPAAAPEAEQDRLAAKLLAEKGTSPWPVCGRQAA